MAGRTFGVVSVKGGTAPCAAMVAQSFNSSTAIEKATAKDEGGKTINVNAYSKSKTISIQGLLDASAPDLEAGMTVVLSGTTFLVDTAEVAESNQDFVRYNLTLSSEDGCVPTAYTAPA